MIAKFNTAAKQTHEIYGINSHDATFENGANLKMVITIETIINKITSNEICIEWNLKKTIDHQKFRNSCKAKKRKAVCFSIFLSAFTSVFQISANEIPIITYRLVHTGAKSDAGGFHEGFCSSANHGYMEGIDKSELIIPVNSQIRIAITSLETKEI